MKKSTLLFALLLVLTCAARAQEWVNLTPKPKAMTVSPGRLELPARFTVSTGNLPEAMAAEADKFADAFHAATGRKVKVRTDDDKALLRMARSTAGLGDEGYELDVTAAGITLKAATPAGFYYGFQTIKKLLPANVMAGVRDKAVTDYALPLVSIQDAPRFPYRGFMLDVARHFFTTEEVKRMIDIMSYYKMNRFHWHLSDDQGWRVEIKKYPELTAHGSIAPNSLITDMKEGEYWLNRPYGPYFYTQEELRDVVAYAKERHIEVIPEIDMPGHFMAAMASYPEYSCTPRGRHDVWCGWGVSTDVLNVADTAAVRFARDILTEIMDIFPYEYIHIGGDECPTAAWEKNELCQQRYKELGLTSYRQLQSHFIQEMARHIQARGRQLMVWNEAITAKDADTDILKSTDATVMCWVGPEAAARKAAELGMDNIITPIGPYYINRKQSTSPSEPPGAGDGKDNLRRTYNYVPVPADLPEELKRHYKGVQGTFWTEHVSDRSYMEYLALPRLIAIAEAGWTQEEDKDFDDFRRRITADRRLLDYGKYNYGRHFMLDTPTADPGVQ